MDWVGRAYRRWWESGVLEGELMGGLYSSDEVIGGLCSDLDPTGVCCCYWRSLKVCERGMKLDKCGMGKGFRGWSDSFGPFFSLFLLSTKKVKVVFYGGGDT